jgi:tetratricopeptide (TPR) repeat protein
LPNDKAPAQASDNAPVRMENDYLTRGKACEEQGDYECAIENYTRAIKARPADAEAYNGRGWAYLEKGRYDRAVEDCARAISLNPDYAGSLRLPRTRLSPSKTTTNARLKIVTGRSPITGRL